MMLLQVLRLLIKLYESVENPDWVNIAQCLLFLDDAPEVAKILDKLLKGSEVSKSSSEPAYYTYYAACFTELACS